MEEKVKEAERERENKVHETEEYKKRLEDAEREKEKHQSHAETLDVLLKGSRLFSLFHKKIEEYGLC